MDPRYQILQPVFMHCAPAQRPEFLDSHMIPHKHKFSGSLIMKKCELRYLWSLALVWPKPNAQCFKNFKNQPYSALDLDIDLILDP